MSTATQVGLSKLDIKALKQADRVCFYHNKDGGTIRCIKEVKSDGPYDDRQREYSLSVESKVRAYSLLGEGQCRHVSEHAKCFEMIYNYKSSVGVIQMLTSVLREGDEIRLNWIADPCNTYMRESTKKLDVIVHYDELRIVIKRGERFLGEMILATSHCPDNTARMIQGA